MINIEKFKRILKSLPEDLFVLLEKERTLLAPIKAEKIKFDKNIYYTKQASKVEIVSPNYRTRESPVGYFELKKQEFINVPDILIDSAIMRCFFFSDRINWYPEIKTLKGELLKHLSPDAMGNFLLLKETNEIITVRRLLKQINKNISKGISSQSFIYTTNKIPLSYELFGDNTIMTTFINGIGLNKKKINLDNIEIEIQPGKALVINIDNITTYTTNLFNAVEQSCCDFSIYCGLDRKSPMKYTKATLNLSHPDNE